MKIFLDTEFCSFDRPKLISIGLVTDDGQEFYRELTDRWHLAVCSMFVVGWVLPWLSGGKTGEKLTALLDLHLDLLQYRYDADNLFPKEKETRLVQALRSDIEMAEHLRFLLIGDDSGALEVWQNPFLLDRIGDMSPCSLLSGAQAMPTKQVAKELSDWLHGFGGVEICVDSDFDIKLLQGLLGKPIPCELISSASKHYPELQIHHALDDARALRLGWLAGQV